MYLKSYSGISLFKEIFSHIELEKMCSQGNSHTLGDVFKSIVGLFALGRYNLNEINTFTTNLYFQESMDINHLLNYENLMMTMQNNLGSLEILSEEILEKYLHRFEQKTSFEFTAKDTLEIYTSSQKNDHYVHDFLAQMNANADMLPLLRLIHFFTTKCLKRFSHQGLTGEIQQINSLFTQEVKSKLDRDGYAIIESVLSVEEVANLKKLVVQIANAEVQSNSAYLYGGANKCQRIYNLLNKNEIFRDLIQKPLIIEIMEHMFARDTLHDKYVLSSWHCNIIGEGGEASILHVDSAVPEPLPEWIIRMNINYMLDDFTADNGATLCLPGSHKFLKKPKKEDQYRTDLVKMIAPKGSLAIWNGHLWHKSGENKTENSRVALLGCFAASHLREMCLEENHLQVLEPKLIHAMSPQLKRLIGVNHGIKKGALLNHENISHELN
jgi:ectoine hydroxylase-related dioxygenase (phytanoyl-CoA dioxygenase family)